MAVCIFNTGLSNLKSVESALEASNIQFVVSDRLQIDSDVSHIIIPGIGSYYSGMDRIRKIGIQPALDDFVASGGKLLGICLGMQLLFSRGEEGGDAEGLGFINGVVKQLPYFRGTGETLPNMGWRMTSYRNTTEPFRFSDDNQFFYYVHSYHCLPANENEVSLVFNYAGKSICAGVSSSKYAVFGVQFHPEKSSVVGLNLLKNFCES